MRLTRFTIRRRLGVSIAALQMGFALAAPASDAWVIARSSGPGSGAHVEQTSTEQCPIAHLHDCAFCRVLTAAAGTTRAFQQVPAGDRGGSLPGTSLALALASLDRSTQLPRAPPLS